MSCAGPGGMILKGRFIGSLKISSENNHTMKLNKYKWFRSECILCKYQLSSKQPKRLQNAQNVFVTGNCIVHCYNLNTWEMEARLGIQGWRWLHSDFKECVENIRKQNSQKKAFSSLSVIGGLMLDVIYNKRKYL